MNWTTIWQLEIRGAFLITVAGLATYLFRKASAARKHALWLAAIVAVGLLPVLQTSAPIWSVSVPVQASALSMDAAYNQSVGAPAAPQTGTASTTGAPEAHSVSDDIQAGLNTPNLILAVWLLISAICLSRILLSMVSARRLVKRAKGVLRPGRFPIIFTDIPVPATVGLLRPVVLLPPEAVTWSVERQEAVICHELTHAHRKDWLWQIMAQVVCALYPFNPFLWIASARLRAQSELACDDLVIMTGHDPADYAQTLLHVARNTERMRISPGVVGMARTPGVEWRIRSILDARRARTSLSARSLLFSGLVAVALGVVVAGVRIVGASRNALGQLHFVSKEWVFAPAKGRVVGTNGRPLPNATIIAMKTSPTESKFCSLGKSDSNGNFDLSSVHLGPKEHISGLGAIVPGYGMGGIGLIDKKSPVEIVCGKPVTLRAEFKTPAGAPAVGEVVYVKAIGLAPRPDVSHPPNGQISIGPQFWGADAVKSAFSAVTDSGGVAEIHGLPQGATVSLEIGDDKYAHLSYRNAELGSNAVTNAGPWLLEASATIEGKILADGKPVAGVKVGAQENSNSKTTGSGFGLTDSDGRYVLKQLPAAIYNVMVDETTLPSGWVARAKVGINAQAGQHIEGVEFDLEHGGLIKGTVNADKETLESGVMVAIYGPAHPLSSAWVQSLGMINLDGTFEARVPAGTQHVYIENYPDPTPIAQDVDVPDGGVVYVHL